MDYFSIDRQLGCLYFFPDTNNIARHILCHIPQVLQWCFVFTGQTYGVFSYFCTENH